MVAVLDRAQRAARAQQRAAFKLFVLRLTPPRPPPRLIMGPPRPIRLGDNMEYLNLLDRMRKIKKELWVDRETLSPAYTTLLQMQLREKREQIRDFKIKHLNEITGFMQRKQENAHLKKDRARKRQANSPAEKEDGDELMTEQEIADSEKLADDLAKLLDEFEDDDEMCLPVVVAQN